jgi:hypothetical protein
MAVEPNPIDYATLGEALAFYGNRGYAYKEVPWVVSDQATEATLPHDRAATKVSYGNLVGSAEQGFIELLMRGEKLTKHCAITPCFRDENAYDDLHHAYFMKCELFDSQATPKRLQDMISDAVAFFRRYLPVDVISTGSGYDIVSVADGIELGSYGFRTYNDTTFIYGTGCALPRLSTVYGIVFNTLPPREGKCICTQNQQITTMKINYEPQLTKRSVPSVSETQRSRKRTRSGRG